MGPRCKSVFAPITNELFSLEDKYQDKFSDEKYLNEKYAEGEKDSSKSSASNKYSDSLIKMQAIAKEKQDLNAQIDALFKKAEKEEENSPKYNSIYNQIGPMQVHLDTLESIYNKIGLKALEHLKQGLVEKDFKVKLVKPGTKELEFIDDIITYFRLQEKSASQQSRLQTLKSLRAPQIIIDETLRLIEKNQARISSLKKKIDHSPNSIITLDQIQNMFGISDVDGILSFFKNFQRPYLVVEALPNSKMIQSLYEKHNERIISSPFIQMRNTNANGSYSESLVQALSVIHISGDVLLSFKNHRETPTLLHEIRHANLAKYRKKGILTPFNLWLEITDGNPMLGSSMKHLTYSKQFSFEEISAHLLNYRLQKGNFKGASLISQFISESKMAVEAALSELKTISGFRYNTVENRFIAELPINYEGKKRLLTVTLLQNPGDNLQAQKKALRKYLKYVQKELGDLSMVLIEYKLAYPANLSEEQAAVRLLQMLFSDDGF